MPTQHIFVIRQQNTARYGGSLHFDFELAKRAYGVSVWPQKVPAFDKVAHNRQMDIDVIAAPLKVKV